MFFNCWISDLNSLIIISKIPVFIPIPPHLTLSAVKNLYGIILNLLKHGHYFFIPKETFFFNLRRHKLLSWIFRSPYHFWCFYYLLTFPYLKHFLRNWNKPAKDTVSLHKISSKSKSDDLSMLPFCCCCCCCCLFVYLFFVLNISHVI